MSAHSWAVADGDPIDPCVVGAEAMRTHAVIRYESSAMTGDRSRGTTLLPIHERYLHDFASEEHFSASWHSSWSGPFGRDEVYEMLSGDPRAKPPPKI